MEQQLNCPSCGASVAGNAANCKYCGTTLVSQQPARQTFQQPYQQPYQPPVQVQYVTTYPPQQASVYDQSWPIKSKTTAGLLAIFLGGLGVHKFYLGKVGMGILYLLFCWTYIPAIVALIEGIIYLASDDHNFQIKNRVRLR